MELKEAIKELQEKIKALDRHIENYEESDCKTKIYLQLVKEKEAIETVLQALKNSIPKKKIEDKIKELEPELELKHFEREAKIQIRLLKVGQTRLLHIMIFYLHIKQIKNMVICFNLD